MLALFILPALSYAALFVLLSASLTFASPLHTSSRWILDASNKRVKLRCVNWAGHAEVQIPEGLQHQPVDTIASWIAHNNFNCVRLTYSTAMALNPTTPVSTAFTSASSTTGAQLSPLYTAALSKNPWLSSATTLSTFARVISSLASQNILVILDNHVSHPSWCCSTTDGNGWWDAASGYTAANSRYFSTQDWLHGLTAMATFARSYPNVVGLSLRNELRATGSQDSDAQHKDWHTYITQCAQAIHNANPDALIMVGGVNYAIDLSFLGTSPLDRTAPGLSNKLV